MCFIVFVVNFPFVVVSCLGVVLLWCCRRLSCCVWRVFVNVLVGVLFWGGFVVVLLTFDVLCLIFFWGGGVCVSLFPCFVVALFMFLFFLFLVFKWFCRGAVAVFVCFACCCMYLLVSCFGVVLLWCCWLLFFVFDFLWGELLLFLCFVV